MHSTLERKRKGKVTHPTIAQTNKRITMYMYLGIYIPGSGGVYGAGLGPDEVRAGGKWACPGRILRVQYL